MNGYKVEEQKPTYGAKIKAIGVGGGGGNMINHIIREGYDKIDLIVANTDQQALDKSLAKTKIQLGPTTTRGLGAGMDPEVGKRAAEESYEDLKDALEYADIVFIGVGEGGGTGTGAAPVVAKAAKENKALAVGIVTTPFNYEGSKKFSIAQKGVEELKKECDSILVISNQKLLSLVDKKAGLKESLKKVDDVLASAVKGMSSIILEYGDSDMNGDFADVKTIMSHRGLALMGTGCAEGEDAIKDAIEDAIQSPLLNDVNINGAMGILIHFKLHPDASIIEFSEAVERVREAAHKDAIVKVATTTDSNIENNRVEVTLIATGFEEAEKINQKLEKEVEKKRDEITENHIKNRVVRSKKVINGIYDDIYDELDSIPAYQRNKMD
ncbi:cell division protein FtsZ [Campylobacter sp. FMV-PI01]|uniref:Cell division protein FtsZ n=1 Tax=Campylobacter portucalensis TaxID=2608384 RepID=A0A6L5WKK0_9BACT|nr:cell division protein FtsZ [Campylobacter portucalensis]MSN96271.1 cell division protein FtsZ [Campylobacter portucalensis]